MNRPPGQSALREWQASFASPRLWATFAIVVFVFTVTGPFGTLERLNGWMRFGYWLTLQGAAWATAMGMSVIVRRLSGERLRSMPALMAASALPAAPLIAFEVQLLNNAVFGLSPGIADWLSNLATSLPLCLLIGLLACLAADPEAFRHKKPGRSDPPVSEAAPSDTHSLVVSGVPLVKRLRPENRGRLVRLSAEDHYTRVVTHAGAEMLLLRFADALSETGPAAGMRVHRSHWVADEAVQELRRDGGRLSLLLSDGAEIPVSRSNAADVRARYGQR